MSSIGVWGDSITYGEGDSEGIGWVGRLRGHLTGKAQVYNRGVCGDTSVNVLRRFALDADTLRPDHVIFAFGANDSKRHKRTGKNKVSLAQFTENTRQLLTEAKGIASKCSVIGLAVVNEQTIRDFRWRFSSEDILVYNARLRELAAEAQVTFIEIFAVLDPSTDLADGLHPNATGYEKLFRAIAPQL